MEESMIPSLSSGAVGSRFVSQNEIDVAKARREEQWKAAYARLGQEPPPRQEDASYDGRSLAEKLAANRIAKQEEWEEKTKLANQFRALEEDEIMFLDSIREKQEAEERQRKEQDGEELKSFKEAVAARTNATSTPLISTQSSTGTNAKVSSLPAKKEQKRVLKGVVVKKRAKPAVATVAVGKASTPRDDDKNTSTIFSTGTSERYTKGTDTDDQPNHKRRKVSET